MSYCRCSSDGFKSDVYVYESAMGYVIDVAQQRLISLELDQFGMPTNHDMKRIDLPQAGQTFLYAELESVLGKLEELAALGYHVPARVIEAIREEAAEEAAEEAKENQS